MRTSRTGFVSKGAR